MAKKSVFNAIKPRRVLYPVLIGLGVVMYLLYRKFDPEVFKIIEFTPAILFWIVVALLLMAFRDIGYIIRIRILSDNQLSWRQAFRIIMLWEFASAITPSAIGGTSVALLFINKEGISVGRSSAIVMATSFLDELYFILTFPVLLIFLSGTDLFASEGMSFTNKYFYFAVFGYGVKFAFTLFISYGLFFNPRGLKWLLLWIFKLPILRRWRQGAHEAGNEIVTSSKELRRKPFKFWLKAFAATFLSWTSRYWIINAIFIAFFIIPDHILLFGRQLVAWIMMLVFPTPGGSGFVEAMFNDYFIDGINQTKNLVPITKDMRESFGIMLILLWRLISYYPYLFIGSVMFPRWISAKFGKGKQKKKSTKDRAIDTAIDLLS